MRVTCSINYFKKPFPTHLFLATLVLFKQFDLISGLGNNNNNNHNDNASSINSNNSNYNVIAPAITAKPTPVALPVFQQTFEQPEQCKDFIESVNNEFHSPNYPGDYFDSLNCVKVVSAEPGEVIRLRFLDHFHLEPDEKCQYDYLEVRDGQFGYSPLIATLCGTSPPTVLESSGRHLWLRFHSDQDLHYIGFRAFYEFVPSSLARPDLDDCSFHLDSLEANITAVDLSPDILINRRDLSLQHLDCTWVIEAPPGQKIYLQFMTFKLEKANDCTYNFVEIYGSRTELYGTDGLFQQYCGSETKPMFSKTNVLHLRFYTVLSQDQTEIGIGFKTQLHMYYNFYRDLSEKGTATEEPDTCREGEEFDCTDNTCIHKDLVCNQFSNCKQGNDEDKVKCKRQKPPLEMTMDLVVIAFIGCFLAAGMCSGLMLNIFRKLRQDKMELEEIRASIHKSKESVGTKSSSDHQQPPPPNNEKKKNKEETMKFVQIQEVTEGKRGSDPTRSSKETLATPTTKKKSSGSGSQHFLQAATPPSQNSSSESAQTVIFKKEPVHQSSSTTSIPYSPPPPYNPSISIIGRGPPTAPPKFPGTSATTPFSENNDDKDDNSPQDEVQVIEVRDCACQTRESFTEKYLRDVYFGTTRHYTKEPSSLSAPRRAPLARSEAVEAADNGFYGSSAGGNAGKRQLRRVPRGNPDVLMYPRAPASIASSVDASTGSLELLNEVLAENDEDDDDEQILRKGSIV